MLKRNYDDIEELDLGGADGQIVDAVNTAAFESEAEELAAIVAAELGEPAAVVPAVSAFDYAGIDPAIAEQARKIADRIRTRIRASVIDVGKDLLAIKDRLGHGKFGPWLAAEFNMSERAAQNYMAAAKAFGDESATIAVLPPTTIYKLAASSTPANVRQAVLTDLKARKPLAAKEVEWSIQIAKTEERQRREKEKEEQRRHALKAKETPEEAKKREAAEARAEKLRKAKEEKAKAEIERHAKAVADVVDFLKQHLGPNFAQFRKLYIAAGCYDVDKALRTEAGLVAVSAAKGEAA